MINICGIVIWYNPSCDDINNIKTYINHIDKLIIVDNSNKDNSDLIENMNNIEYMPNYKNLGIAKALNIGCNRAISYGYKWVLTMDQDSSFDKFDDYMKKFNELSKNNNKIAIFAPAYSKQEEGYVNRVITSGNILNLKAYKDVNRFDDRLFIDEVDHDLCFRLLQKEYKIYKIGEIKFNHKLGNCKKVKLISKEFICMNHNYIRKYYITRNRCIVKKRYPKYTRHYTKDNIYDFIKVILGEDDKFRKCKYMIKGYIDYKKGKLGEIDF